MANQIPLRGVTLYKNNLAFFGREVVIPKIEQRQLSYELKVPRDSKRLVVDSMSVQGPGMLTVSYGGNQQSNPELTYSFGLGGNSTLEDFLKTAVGARIHIESGMESYDGELMIVDTQRVPIPHTENMTAKTTILILTDSGDLERVAIDDAVKIKIADAKLQAEIARCLKLQLQSRRPVQPVDSRNESIRISATVKSEEDIKSPLRVSYIDKAQEWKGLYHLIVSSKDANDPNQSSEEAGSKLMFGLEMLARLTNTTDQDWEEVGPSWVADLSFSFVFFSCF
eukprot:Colp12_sorted_trinity150504_noHs@18202